MNDMGDPTALPGTAAWWDWWDALPAEEQERRQRRAAANRMSWQTENAIYPERCLADALGG